MSRWRQHSFVVRLCLVILLLAFCSLGTFWANKVYRRPLNPVSAVAIVEEEPEFLPEFNDVEFVTAPPPSPVTSRFPTTEGSMGGQTDLSPEITPSIASNRFVTGTAVATLMDTPDPTSPNTVAPPTTLTLAETPISASQRITILIMGSDSRVQALVSRTDTMMLLSVNMARQTVSLLSIPRDLYVEIPGYGRDKLNTALIHGANINGEDPVAGMVVAIQTVEQALGVHIDHYVVVSLGAVEETIDALGGVDVYVPYTISDPTYINRETGEALYIPEGPNHFDGDTALRYARTRFQDSDFARANRQQQLLMAIRYKVLSLGLAEMIDHAPLLYQNVRSGIFTDLSLEDMVNLAQVANEIPEENIHTAVLNKDYVVSSLSPEGSYILYLIPEKVMPLIQEMFYDQDNPETPPTAEE